MNNRKISNNNINNRKKRTRPFSSNGILQNNNKHRHQNKARRLRPRPVNYNNNNKSKNSNKYMLR